MIFETIPVDGVHYEMSEEMEGLYVFSAVKNYIHIFTIFITENQKNSIMKQLNTQGILELTDVPF